ncbi:P-loop containing nucleoside triphosphate hydrolase protein [Hyaloraphidium curvatum]|nr:P-loop containing nucleoside triphosphate hydrolase protein [Hyaloraphidium curvatum]
MAANGRDVAVDVEKGKPGNPQLYLEWRDLCLEVPDRNNKKSTMKILDGASGSVASGEVLAVLGPSGCGKTTLLNVLSARVYSGKVTGTVLINGQHRPKDWPSLTGMVQQDDVVYEELTVMETMRFAAKLRLPKGTPEAEIDSRCRMLLSELGLAEVENVMVGNSVKKGISGGQRKRLIVASELVDQPDILFLDEPTSGLDASSAIILIEALQKMARREGSIIILTIHQPRASIFSSFDKVCIMSKGREAFFGPPAAALDHWTKMGLPVPEGDNPADHYLDTVTISGLTPEARTEQGKQLEALLQAWNRDRPPVPPNTFAPVMITRGSGPGVQKPGWTTQFSANLKRQWQMFVRDRGSLVSTVVQTLVIAMFLGIVFFGMTEGAGALLLRLLALFFVTFVTLVVNLLPIVQAFALERRILVRERSSNTYDPSSFYLAKLAIVFPIATISSIVIVSISYWMMNFVDSAQRFFLYMVAVVVLAWIAQALGLVIGSWIENPQTGAGIAQIVVLVAIVFGGLFSGFELTLNPPNQMPNWISWIQWLSPANYAFRAMAQMVLQGEKFRCDLTIGQSTICLVTGDDALQMFGVSYPTAWICILIELGMFCVFHILAIIGLYTTLRRKPIII